VKSENTFTLGYFWLNFDFISTTTTLSKNGHAKANETAIEALLDIDGKSHCNHIFKTVWSDFR